MATYTFSGEYRLALDVKKRINIPAGIRKMLHPESDDSLVFARGFEGCVFVFPPDEWNFILTNELAHLNDFNAEVRKFKRILIGSAQKIKMDNQGRILLSDNILELAGITRDILLRGNLNKWEMWNPDRYSNYEATGDDTYEGLAQKLSVTMKGKIAG